MPTPIKSPHSNAQTANGGMPHALNELVNKLNAQASEAMVGVDGQSPQQAFSRWLEKHALGADAASRQGAQPSQTNAAQANAQASRSAEQALARARQMAAPTAKAFEPKPIDAGAQAKVRNEQRNTAKPASKEGAPKSGQADKPAEGEGKQDEVNFSTAAGDGAAVVRELTPPPSIQPGDSAGMMAWLASLTSGDLQGQALAEEADGAQAGGQGDASGTGVDLAAHGKGAHGQQGGMALDLNAWQTVGGKAEAMLEQFSGQAEGDPLAGVMAGGAAKTSGFGQILGEAGQKIRHESATLNTPFGSPQFPQALAEKVSMWVGQARQDGTMTAELHLNPAEMGPINVKISLNGQGAHVDFAAAALETRQAIEASLPMLSNALNDVGLSLTGGDVSSQTSQQAFEQAAAREGGSLTGARGSAQGDQADDGEALSTRQVAPPRAGRPGGLDLYA